MPLQVTCIKKRDRPNPHERIEGIGGGTMLSRWYHLEDDAIRNVERDPSSYFASVRGNSVWVVVATHNGRKYLKTEPDRHPENNLLNLAECA